MLKRKIAIIFVLLSFLLMPLVAMADTCSEVTCKDKTGDELDDCISECRDGLEEGSSGSIEFENPIKINNPQDIVANVIKAVLGLVGSLALALFIYGGLVWMFSSGNPEKVKKGRDVLIWASLGLAVIFASYALMEFILNALAEAT